jgi:prepilin-type N-terminal cleavage/methylation domain-containing protein
MNSTKGFTLLEVLVALAIFSMVAAAAMTFYRYQTKQGAASGRKKIAQETATLSLMRLKRDIVGAGFSLVEAERGNLAAWVVDGAGEDPDELLLSSCPYVDLDLAATKPAAASEPQPYSFFTFGSLKAGQDKAWFELPGGSTELVLSDVNRAVDKRSLGALILSDPANPFLAYDEDDKEAFKIQESSTTDQDKKGKHDLKFKWLTGVAADAAPAVRYRLRLAEDTGPTLKERHQNRGTLLRNEVAIAGAQATPTGFTGDATAPLVKITDFQVRCQFNDGQWSPDDVTFGSSGHGGANLRLIEVTVRYLIRSAQSETGGFGSPDKVNKKGFRIPNDTTFGPWIVGGTYVMRVAPRNIILFNYLGSS